MGDVNFLYSGDVTAESPSKKKERKDFGIKSIITLMLVGSICVLLFLAPNIGFRVIENQTMSIRESLSDEKYQEVITIKNNITIVEDKLTIKKMVIKDIDKKHVPSSTILEIVNSSLPEGCFINMLDYKNSTLNISGFANDNLVIAEFISNLDNLKLLERLTDALNLREAEGPISFQLKYAVGKDE